MFNPGSLTAAGAGLMERLYGLRSARFSGKSGRIKPNQSKTLRIPPGLNFPVLCTRHPFND
jgi:hypothetical protein